MKRVIVLLSVAAVMLAMSALPALARPTTEVQSCKEFGKSVLVIHRNENGEVIKLTGGCRL